MSPRERIDAIRRNRVKAWLNSYEIQTAVQKVVPRGHDRHGADVIAARLEQPGNVGRELTTAELNRTSIEELFGFEERTARAGKRYLPFTRTGEKGGGPSS